MKHNQTRQGGFSLVSQAASCEPTDNNGGIYDDGNASSAGGANNGNDNNGDGANNTGGASGDARRGWFLP
jgi:hypothetical protein